jgi:hypothetical protein
MIPAAAQPSGNGTLGIRSILFYAEAADIAFRLFAINGSHDFCPRHYLAMVILGASRTRQRMR